VKRNYNLHALDIIAYVFPSSPPPEGVTWRAFQIVARDPERDLARWCSATIQATAEVMRYEVDLDLDIGLLSNTDQDAAREWAGDLELALQAEDSEHQLWFSTDATSTTARTRWSRSRSTTMTRGHGPREAARRCCSSTSWPRARSDQMAEDETGNPTCVTPRPARKEKA
jgi:hypothetical protein